MEKNKEKEEEQSIMDKSMRSVFVGNIPYEATEEKLKDIFSEVGPVLSFKLVFDRETGKPKGYGFCEYKDQETALSAMRNLNGYEIGGRSLRVDNACTEKSRMEMQALMQGPQIENPYGEPVDPEKAPEAISKAVATLPPEQMFELMKQMKLCIQVHTRYQTCLYNALSYIYWFVQYTRGSDIRMAGVPYFQNIIVQAWVHRFSQENNPSEARNMLLQNPQLAYALLQAQVIMRIVDPATAVTMLQPSNPVPPVLQPGDKPPLPPQNSYMPNNPPLPVQQPPPPLLSIPVPPPNQYNPRPPIGDVDLRGSRAAAPAVPPLLDQDMRSLPPMVPHPVPPPHLPPQDPNFQRDPRMGGMQPFNPDPRVRPIDPRSQSKMPPPQMPPGMPSAAQARTIQGIPSGASDQEKAALIMQVLQLSDDQIALLPPEQRASILMLKEQIAKSTQQR